MDVIEDLSHEVKRSMLQEKQGTLRDAPSTSSSELLAEQQRALFNRGDEGEHEEVLVSTVCSQDDFMVAVAFSSCNFCKVGTVVQWLALSPCSTHGFPPGSPDRGPSKDM